MNLPSVIAARIAADEPVRVGLIDRLVRHGEDMLLDDAHLTAPVYSR